MKPCKSADHFIKVSFHNVVDMRQGESNIPDFNLESFFIIKNIFIMKNPTDLVKRLKPIWIRACPIVLLVNLQPLANVRLNVGMWLWKQNFSIMNFGKSESWKTTVWDSNDSNKTGMGSGEVL